MGFWWKKQGNSVGKTGEKATSGLTAAQRGDIIALYEDGYRPSEISTELNIDAERINKVIELEKRKTDRAAGPAPADDPIRKAREEIAALELQKKQLELQWAIDDRKAERDEELAERAASLLPGSEMGQDGQGFGQDPADMMLMQLFMAAIQSRAPGAGAAPGAAHGLGPAGPLMGAAPGPAPAPVEFTAQEIEAIIDQEPEAFAKLQKLPDALILRTIKSSYPMISDATAQLGLEVLKKKKLNKVK